MKNVSTPLSAEAVHDVYAGKKVDTRVSENRSFKSTGQFDRDPSHPGHAPEVNKVAKGPFRR